MRRKIQVYETLKQIFIISKETGNPLLDPKIQGPGVSPQRMRVGDWCKLQKALLIQRALGSPALSARKTESQRHTSFIHSTKQNNDRVMEQNIVGQEPVVKIVVFFPLSAREHVELSHDPSYLVVGTFPSMGSSGMFP